MGKESLVQLVDLPFCQAMMLEQWDAAPGRFFAAYRARHGFTCLLGNGVVDEYRTISAPILLAPAAIVGGIYDAGMRLADLRDVEAPIDQGWPPLTIGIDVKAPDRNEQWRDDMRSALQSGSGKGSPPWENKRRSSAADQYKIQSVKCVLGGRTVACIIVTDAPMLPEQLDRLADTGDSPITVAVSVGNRLPRVQNGEWHEVDVISEQVLAVVVREAAKA